MEGDGRKAIAWRPRTNLRPSTVPIGSIP
ncbi:hypothetical protein A2U01_0040136, partial [Trifolium medium]|nr:hypothetical protein [Trifolium medium]